MKKLLSVLCSISVIVMLTVSASATGYVTSPNYDRPTLDSTTKAATTPAASTQTAATPISATDVTKAIADGKTIDISSGTGTLVSLDVISAIAKSSTPVTLQTINGQITIDPATITDKAIPVDLNIPVTTGDNALQAVKDMLSNADVPAGTLATLELPDNAIVIAPPTHGEYGFAVTITVPSAQVIASGIDPAKAKVYHVSGTEVVEVGNVTVNADGSISITITGASGYVIAESAPVVIFTAEDSSEPEDLNDDDYEEETDYAGEDEGEDTDVGDDTDVDDTSDDVSESESDVEDGGATVTDGSSTTSDKNPSTGVATVVLAAGVSGLVALVSKKSKK